MSATPYSDAWRERTRERMAAFMLDEDAVEAALGFSDTEIWRGRVSLEVAGPIDELLAKLEEQAEAKALDECIAHHPGVGSVRVRRVGVDLGPLDGRGVEFTARPFVPPSADPRVEGARSRRSSR
jgi:hypothetical protein